LDTSVTPPAAGRLGVILKIAAPVRRLLTRRHWVFQLTVLLPVALASLYYGLIASDVYVSESRFVVRNHKQQTSLPLDSSSAAGSLLESSGLMSHGGDEASSVHDYILSRDALRELDAKLDLKRMFSSHDIDFLNRFHGLVYWRNNFEWLYLYYGDRVVDAELDTSSSITTLSVRAFTPQDAQRINAMLVGLAEQLVNRMNERSRHDLIDVAAEEVHLAEARVVAATLALSTYRNKQRLYEPDIQSEQQLEGVRKLQGDLIAAEAQIAQIRKVSPSNPGLPALVAQADALRSAVASETSKVAGGHGSLSSKSTEFERLTLEQGFAEKQLEIADITLESARSDARRQELYLDRLVEPNSPDYAMEPRRFRSVAVVLAIGVIAWGVLSLILASVREHLD
jgi:capsular polysaccharide transport system permease protein